MKIECEIQSVRTSKKGDTMTVFIPKEHRQLVVEHIMKFIEKPVTLEILVNTQKVLENMDRITEDQRKKCYALFKDFAKEYGDTSENVKELLKQEYYNISGETFSLSDCTSEIASKFIEWVLSYSRAKGYGFAFIDSDTAGVLLLSKKKCFVCQSDGIVYGNEQGKICLCDKHKEELQTIGTKEFMSLYHLELV